MNILQIAFTQAALSIKQMLSLIIWKHSNETVYQFTCVRCRLF